MNGTRCHTCNSALTICTDVFGRAYCYDHARKWIDHLAAVVESGDVHRWCEHGGMAGPKELLITEDSRMLVLSRKVGQSIVIDGDITVTVISASGERIRLGITAPEQVRISRSELGSSSNESTTEGTDD